MSKKKKPEPVAAKVNIQYKHMFSPEEKNDLYAQHIQKLGEVDSKTEAKEAAMSTFKAAIKELKSHATDLRHQLSNGFEMRTATATVEFNRKKGIKKFFHYCPASPELHGKLIREETMTEEEHNLLPLEGVNPGDERQPPGGSGELEIIKKPDEDTEEPRVHSAEEAN
jgi:neutral trehalase